MSLPGPNGEHPEDERQTGPVEEAELEGPLRRVEQRRIRDGYLMIAAAASLWGTWSLFLRPAERISPLDPAIETFVLFATIAAMTLPLALRERTPTRRPSRSWALMIAVGATDAANVGCFFWAMQKGSLAVAVLSHYLAPLLIALAAPVVLGERARFPALALASALGGLCLLVWPGGSSQGDMTKSAVLGSTSAVFYMMTTLLNKRLERDFSARELLAYHSVAAALLLGPALFVAQRATALSLGYVVVGSAVLSAWGGLVYLNGLRRVPASRAAILTLLEPVVALMLGVLVWREPMTARGAFGAVLVLAGAYLVLKSADEAVPAASPDANSRASVRDSS
jgi:drug/metabolite transporter (DMT)-like permease